MSLHQVSSICLGNLWTNFDSLWRPLVTQVEDSPLAVCDPRTVESVDLIATDRWSPEYVGEVWDCFYRESQTWYWLSKQRQEELLMFSTFDSLSRITKQILGMDITVPLRTALCISAQCTPA